MTTQTSRAIRIDQNGGPEELKLVSVQVGDPGPGEIRIRHHAVGLNFIDVYQRSGVSRRDRHENIDVTRVARIAMISHRVAANDEILNAMSAQQSQKLEEVVRYRDHSSRDSSAAKVPSRQGARALTFLATSGDPPARLPRTNVRQ